ncbi:MAG: helix-turn-helix transcriptional regulator [Nitrosopumilaceae archaeon]
MAIKITSLIKLYTILILMEKPEHGYDIMKQLEKRTGKNVGPSQVYPFLDQLEKEGIITGDKAGKRDKTVYKITKKGKEFVNEIINRAERLFEVALSSKIEKCAHCGCKVLEGGVEKNGKIFCCSSCEKNF